MIDQFVAKAREIYGSGFIPLHRPVFEGNEVHYLEECIRSNFVSSVGQRVVDFENQVAEFTGASYAVAVVNGTAALQVALRVAGVLPSEEVITQDLTFVATANAICHLNASPVFLDVDEDTMGLSPSSVLTFLENNAKVTDRGAVNKCTGKRISACVPMHTFGNPARIETLKSICDEWKIALIEDAAESLGSYIGNKHTGTVGELGILSFNGNKVITTGGGGMIITSDKNLADHAKHLTTTAKQPHEYEFLHDEVAYNFRMPNLNAALGCAQMETLQAQLNIKERLADEWARFFDSYDVQFIRPLDGCTSNNWLNAIRLKDRQARDEFLTKTNAAGVMTRPIWELMSRLTIFKQYYRGDNENARDLADTIVNISSSVPDGWLGPVKEVEM
jgi:aminotransferase in exopolysaccharide biosynthesis